MSPRDDTLRSMLILRSPNAGGTRACGLLARLIDRDHDLARFFAGKGQGVGRLVLVAEFAVQVAHRGVIDERDRYLLELIETIECMQHFAGERGDVTAVARLAGDVN